jgi:hypothetical protein
VITGALWETAAFAFRILSARNPTQKGSYDASFLLILLAPVCVNAFDYMIVSRIVRSFLPKIKVFGLKGTVFGKLFVCCDVMLESTPSIAAQDICSLLLRSFLVQIGGGLLSLSKKAKTAKTGLHIVTGGVLFQEALIVFFFALTIRTTQKLGWVLPPSGIGNAVKRRIHAVQISLFLITVRLNQYSALRVLRRTPSTESSTASSSSLPAKIAA